MKRNTGCVDEIYEIYEFYGSTPATSMGLVLRIAFLLIVQLINAKQSLITMTCEKSTITIIIVIHTHMEEDN